MWDVPHDVETATRYLDAMYGLPRDDAERDRRIAGAIRLLRYCGREAALAKELELEFEDFF